MSAPSLSTSSVASAFSSASSAASSQLSAEEAAIYDRQLRVWGIDAQKRMRSASVCIVGINGLGAEVAKNIVLAGIGSLTLLDSHNTTSSDLSAQFLLTQEDIGHNRATASARRLTLLNPSVQLTCDESEPDAKEIDWWHQFQAVIVMDAARHTQLRIHRACRLHKIESVNCWIADSAGMFAYFLEDLHHHQYTVTQKEDKENPSTEPPKTTQHTLTYTAMESVLSLPWSSILTAFGIRHAPSAFIYLLLTTLAQYRDTYVDWPPTKDDKHKALYRDLISQHLTKAQLSTSSIPEELIETVWRCAGLQLSPVCAIAGGYLGQEILKVLSGRDEPLQNVFVYNGNLSHALIKHVR